MGGGGAYLVLQQSSAHTYTAKNTIFWFKDHAIDHVQQHTRDKDCYQSTEVSTKNLKFPAVMCFCWWQITVSQLLPIYNATFGMWSPLRFHSLSTEASSKRVKKLWDTLMFIGQITKNLFTLVLSVLRNVTNVEQ